MSKEAPHFQEWPLHDAVLKTISIDWVERTCCMRVLAFLEKHQPAVACSLVWTGVTHVDVPIRELWGPSQFINSQQVDSAARYAIEMQSGDTIRVEASCAAFERDVAEVG